MKNTIALIISVIALTACAAPKPPLSWNAWTTNGNTTNEIRGILIGTTNIVIPGGLTVTNLGHYVQIGSGSISAKGKISGGGFLSTSAGDISGANRMLYFSDNGTEVIITPLTEFSVDPFGLYISGTTLYSTDVAPTNISHAFKYKGKNLFSGIVTNSNPLGPLTNYTYYTNGMVLTNATIPIAWP